MLTFGKRKLNLKKSPVHQNVTSTNLYHCLTKYEVSCNSLHYILRYSYQGNLGNTAYQRNLIGDTHQIVTSTNLYHQLKEYYV